MTEPRPKYPPYLIRRPGADAVRYFWQPSRALRADGWAPQRVPDSWDWYTDPAELEQAAIAKAEELNAALHQARRVAMAQAPRGRSLAPIEPQYPLYLTTRPGSGGVVKYFWQPSRRLVALGARVQRVPDRWERFSDPADLERAARAKAAELSKAAIEGKPKPKVMPPVKLRDLILRYQAAPEFRDLVQSTKRSYNQCIDKLLDSKLGAKVLRSIGPADVQRLRSDLSQTPSVANHVLAVLQLLFTFAVHHGVVEKNPVSFRKFKAPPSGVPWPREAVVAFVRAADEMGCHAVGTAVMLNEWLGQRPADVLRLKRTDYRGGTIYITQSKTGASVQLPVVLVPHLVKRLAEEFERQRKWRVTATTIIVSRRGRPYTVDGFAKLFGKIRAEAAKTTPPFTVDFLVPGRKPRDPDANTVRMVDLEFRHLRHTAITRMAENGCEDSLIASVSGHSHLSITSIITRYCSRTGTQARLAFKKRLAGELERAEEAELVALANRPLIEAQRGD